MTQKTLYILRHAEAEQESSGTDEARVLTPSGAENAVRMGYHLLEHHIKPEKTLCSTSERTRETLHHVERTLGEPMEVDYSERLYLASLKDLLAVIAQTGEETSSLLVVGHNPDLHQLCVQLAATGDREQLERLSLEFPPCSFATIELGEAAWAQITATRGTLTHFVTPKWLAAAAEV